MSNVIKEYSFPQAPKPCLDWASDPNKFEGIPKCKPGECMFTKCCNYSFREGKALEDKERAPQQGMISL